MLPLAQVKILSLGATNLKVYSFYNQKGINIKDASVALGYDSHWLSTAINTSSNLFNRLQANGYIDDRQHVIINDKHGETIHTVISLKSFQKLIVQESIDNNSTALILLLAFAEIGIESILGISQHN